MKRKTILITLVGLIVLGIVLSIYFGHVLRLTALPPGCQWTSTSYWLYCRDYSTIEFPCYADYCRLVAYDCDVDPKQEPGNWKWFGDLYSYGEVDSPPSYKMPAKLVRREYTCPTTTTTTTTIYCEPRWLDEYRCYGNWRQRRYLEEDCDKVWKNWEYCDYGCENGECLPPPTTTTTIPQIKGELYLSIIGVLSFFGSLAILIFALKGGV